MAPASFQASSILRYSVILFCRFLAAIRLAALMISMPTRTRLVPARAAFSMKRGILWQRVSTCTISLTLKPWFSRRSMMRSKIASQSLWRARLSSVMKKWRMPCFQCSRMVRSTSSAVRPRDLRPCTLMIVQNEHWYGTAAAGVEARQGLDRAPQVLLGEDRRRLGFESRQFLEVVVDRLERADAASVRMVSTRPSSSPANRLTPMSRATFRSACSSGSMARQPDTWKPPIDHLHAGGAERPRDVEGAGKLIRLHADDAEEAVIAVATELRQQLVDLHAAVDLVDDRDVDGGVGPENCSLGRRRARGCTGPPEYSTG